LDLVDVGWVYWRGEELESHSVPSGWRDAVGVQTKHIFRLTVIREDQTFGLFVAIC